MIADFMDLERTADRGFSAMFLSCCISGGGLDDPGGAD